YTYEQEYRDKQQLYDPENRMMKAVERSISNFPFSHVVIEGYIDFSPLQYLFIDYFVKHDIPFSIYLPSLDMPIIHETVAALQTLGVQIQSEIPTTKVVCEKMTLSSATTIEEEIHGVLET